MASSDGFSGTPAGGGRKPARSQRQRSLDLESLEPRLAMATGLLGTVVSVFEGVENAPPSPISGVETLAQPTLGRTETFIVTATPDDGINVGQYSGTWYEQGSVKQVAAAALVNTVSVYNPRPDGSVQVVDTSRVGGPTGPVRRSVGSAIAVDSMNDRWNVSFPGSTLTHPRGNYWIVDFATNYSWAIVSDRSGGNGRILTRERDIEPTLYRDLVQRAAYLGVDTSRLTRTPQLIGGPG